MIAEFMASLFTPAPKWVREMGYVREAIAIEARAKRCMLAWEPHQTKTKNAILEAVSTRQQNRTVLVVGSGACLDIPLTELSEIFERVVLVDIVHPRKSKSHGLQNVLQVDLDITGQMEALHKTPDILPDVVSPLFYHDFPDIDFVLSVNVASQLPVIPLQYLAKTTRRKLSHEDIALDGFSKNIVSAHFKWLSGFKCPVAVICDKQWEYIDLNGRPLELIDPLSGYVLPQSNQEWYWEIAPAKELGSDYSCRNRVGYWLNFLITASDDISAPLGGKSRESK